MDFVIFVVILIFGVGMFFVIWGLLPSGKDINIEFRLGEKVKDKETSSIFLKYSRPIFSKVFMGVLSQLDMKNYEKGMERKLITAGLRPQIDPIEVMAYKLWMMIIFPISFYMMLWVGEIEVPIYVTLTGIVFGFFYPDLWISGSRKQRQRGISLSMPFVVDLLCLSTEAGLDFIASVARVIEKASRGPLVDELEQFLNETRLGSTRAEALDKLAWRVDMMEMDTFCGMLKSADEMGSSIGPVLRAQSEQIRHERFIKAEKAGQAASQKILFPLIFFILPAVFIMIFGPLVVKFITEGNPF